jgi:uncharacterized protein YkwD
MLKTVLMYIFFLFIIGCGQEAVKENSNITNFNKPSNREILEAINRARAEPRDCHDGVGIRNPVPPLVWNEELYQSAYEHSRDLAKSNTFNHLGSGTEYDITGYNRGGKRSLFYERIEDNGYKDYNIVGENIAGGQNSVEQLMEDLLNSPKHCANIMNSNFKEVGVAVYIEEDSKYKIYWTQNFGG